MEEKRRGGRSRNPGGGDGQTEDNSQASTIKQQVCARVRRARRGGCFTFSPTFSLRVRLARMDSVKTTTVRLLWARKLMSVR